MSRDRAVIVSEVEITNGECVGIVMPSGTVEVTYDECGNVRLDVVGFTGSVRVVRPGGKPVIVAT